MSSNTSPSLSQSASLTASHPGLKLDTVLTLLGVLVTVTVALLGLSKLSKLLSSDSTDGTLVVGKDTEMDGVAGGSCSDSVGVGVTEDEEEEGMDGMEGAEMDEEGVPDSIEVDETDSGMVLRRS